jgi:hypothetical protein
MALYAELFHKFILSRVFYVNLELIWGINSSHFIWFWAFESQN